MNTSHIAVFGSLTIDLFVQPKECQVITQSTENSSHSLFALPHGGKISAESIQEHFGGGASNVAVSFSRFQNTVSCFGGVGDDNNAEKIVQNIKHHNIETHGIQKYKNTKSGFSLILNAFDGERTVIFTSEANKQFESLPNSIGEEENIDAIYLCHLSAPNPKNIHSHIESFLTKNPEKKFFWNPGKESIKKGIQKNITLLQNCDILFLNTEEAEEFSGLLAQKNISNGEEMRKQHTLAKNIHQKDIPDFVHTVQHIAEKFLSIGVKNIVITDGRKGAQVFSPSEHIFIPCISSTRVDTLGAGDSFASCFSSFFLTGESLQKCGEYASINAASVVAHQGAQDGLLTRTQILQK